MNIDKINRDFYDSSGDAFDAIPFGTVLLELILKYGKGHKILEIGSGPGALAVWLREQGYEVTCIEPALKLAEKAMARGFEVYPLTIQEFTSENRYDSVIAISSLIHVPKNELPPQVEKIRKLLKPNGVFFVSFIEGEGEGFEDPTKTGRQRFFSKWTEPELDELLKPHFIEIERRKIRNKIMDRAFILGVYCLK